MPYKALTYVNLPPDNRKAPGDSITAKELKDAGQGDAEIKQLVDGKMISEDMNADLDEAHHPIEILPSANPQSIDVITGEVGQGGDNNNGS